MPGYSSWRTERSGGDKGGGGLCIFYKERLSPHQWSPQVPEPLKYIEKERQWLLIDNGKERVALLHCYIACQSQRSDSYLQWNEDLFQLVTEELLKLREQGFLVVCMGDFNSRIGRVPGLENNTPDVNRNGPMFMNFVAQANLVIMNTLPVAQGLFTRFMNGSQSLLDYGLVDSDHVNTVSSFVIDADARFGCGSDHALLIAQLVFGEKPAVRWAFREVLKFNFDDKSDYTEYKNELDNCSRAIPLHKFEELPAEDKLTHVTNCIIDSGKKTFGLKMKNKRRKQTLPRHLVDMIQEKNHLARQVHADVRGGAANILEMKDDLAKLKLDIQDAFMDIKLQKRARLRTRLLLADPSRKRFWRFLKNQIKSAGTITAAYDSTGKMVFQQSEIEDAVVDYFSNIFSAQKSPVYSSHDHPDMVALSLEDINNMLAHSPLDCSENQFKDDVCPPFTLAELTQTLDSLPSAKASGFDQIPNEFLRNSSSRFQQYLLSLFNQIIHDGIVPETLNIGKCMLIHKVTNI